MESDVYRDTSGKIRKIPGAVPYFVDVTQFSKTQTKTAIEVDFDPARIPSEQLERSLAEETSPTHEDIDERAGECENGFQYEFLDEALEHPEGLGFKKPTDQNRSINKENCKNCTVAESRSQIDGR